MERPTLHELRIENYGCIRDATFRFTPLHALIGPNDSGKTTVLRALRTIARTVDTAIDQRAMDGLTAALRANKTGSRFELSGPTVTYTMKFQPNGMYQTAFRERAADATTDAHDETGWPARNFVHADAWTPPEEVKDALRGTQLLRLDPDFLRAPHALIADGSPLRFDDERGTGLPALYDALLVRDLPAYMVLKRRRRGAAPPGRLPIVSATARKVRVFLCGEGRNELGSRCGHPAYQTDEQPGVLHALLARVEATGWEVGGARDWTSIRKYKAGAEHRDTRNVLGIALDAKEARCEVLAFSRDLDTDVPRKEAIEEGLRLIPETFAGAPVVIGGVAVPTLEGWILALLAVVRTEELTPKRAHRLLEDKGVASKDGEAMVHVVEDADLAALPEDAVSLGAWLARARAVLQERRAPDGLPELPLRDHLLGGSPTQGPLSPRRTIRGKRS